MIPETLSSTSIAWYDKIDLFQIVAIAALGIVGYFITRTLRQIDCNQQATAETLHQLTKDFYTLQGEHYALCGRRERVERVE